METKGVFCLSKLRLAKGGDVAAGEELAKELLNWARRRLGSYRDLDPEDLAGTFAANLSRDHFASLPDKDAEGLEDYLHCVLRNLALNELRRMRRRPWPAGLPSPNADELIADSRTGNPEVVVLGREAVRNVFAAAQVLSSENRQLLFALAGGASHKELADQFSLKPNTLSQRLWSVRRQIGRALEFADT